MTKTEFDQTKQECIATLRDALQECFVLFHSLSECVKRCEMAETEEQLEAVEKMVMGIVEDFKHIEIIG